MVVHDVALNARIQIAEPLRLIMPMPKIVVLRPVHVAPQDALLEFFRVLLINGRYGFMRTLNRDRLVDFHTPLFRQGYSQVSA